MVFFTSKCHSLYVHILYIHDIYIQIYTYISVYIYILDMNISPNIIHICSCVVVLFKSVNSSYSTLVCCIVLSDLLLLILMAFIHPSLLCLSVFSPCVATCVVLKTLLRPSWARKALQKMK